MANKLQPDHLPVLQLAAANLFVVLHACWIAFMGNTKRELNNTPCSKTATVAPAQAALTHFMRIGKGHHRVQHKIAD